MWEPSWCYCYYCNYCSCRWCCYWYHYCCCCYYYSPKLHQWTWTWIVHRQTSRTRSHCHHHRHSRGFCSDDRALAPPGRRWSHWPTAGEHRAWRLRSQETRPPMKGFGLRCLVPWFWGKASFGEEKKSLANWVPCLELLVAIEPFLINTISQENEDEEERNRRRLCI